MKNVKNWKTFNEEYTPNLTKSIESKLSDIIKYINSQDNGVGLDADDVKNWSEDRINEYYDELFPKQNEELNMKHLLIAGLIFLASCTSVTIKNHDGKKIPNIEYSNKTVNGVIEERHYVYDKNDPHYKCYVNDNNGNVVKLNISTSLFNSSKRPQVGDNVKLIFDKEGDDCEVYKNSKNEPGNFKRVHGGGTGGWFN